MPDAYASITRYVPGGVRAYGLVMALLGFMLFHGLLPVLHGRTMFDEWLVSWLELTALFSVCVTIAFAISWGISGVLTWQAMVYWGSISLFAGLCALHAPDPPVDRYGSVG